MSGVLVVMEQRGGVINRMSFEALSAGQTFGGGAGRGVFGCDCWRWCGGGWVEV